MTKISGTDILFFKELFGNEVYRIGDKNQKPKPVTNVPGMVKEQEAEYITSTIDFQGIASATLILMHYPGQNEIPEADKVFLDQVLKAAGQNFDNLAWLNTAGLTKEINWTAIAKQSPSENVIAFGVDTRYLPDRIADGWVNHANGKKVICASSLAEISNDPAKKKLLWQGLKEIYGL